MGRKALDLLGQTFGKLTVVERAGSAVYRYADKHMTTHARWLCRCACGREVMRTTAYLRSRDDHSCGCVRVK